MIDKNSQAFKSGKVIIEDIYCMQTNEIIGKGSFGEIYKGYNTKTNKKLAFKLEASINNSQLTTEYKIYKEMEGCGI